MRIALDPERTVWSSGARRRASRRCRSPLADGGPKLLVFENPAHDYPTRITYRRDGDRLVATISGPNGANPMSWRYRRR